MSETQPGASKGAAEEVVIPPSHEVRRLDCRFYERQYPEVEEIVVVNVKNIAEMGAYVTLLEYNNIEGLILLSELSRRRIRSINKLIRVGRTECVMVLRVDRDKGYIDLSKRRVSPEDVIKCEDRFNKAKAVHSVLRHVAEQQGFDLEDLYRRIGWPLYRKYGHAYDAFKLCLADQANIFDDLEDISEETQEALKSYIKRRLAPQPIKIRADVEVTCFTYEGIDAIKEVLLAGQDKGTSDNPVRVRLIAPPMYVMTCMTLDKDLGKEILEQAIQTMAEMVASKGGRLEVKMPPKAVSQREETELQAMMDRLAAENEDVDGDMPEEG